MMLNLIDRLGEWNPQLFRELKGRLKFFNVAIAVVTSLLLQLVIFLYQLRDFPGEKYSLKASYCHLHEFYDRKESLLYTQQSALNQQLSDYQQIKPPNLTKIANIKVKVGQVNTAISNLRSYLENNFCPENEIGWQSWWRDHWEYFFLTFSVIFIFTLLVAGTYLLISDLAKEENRGTLNFIRLSPQSEASILTGKLIGVPSLIYLFIIVAIPLHIWAGHSAKIALSYIFSYYAVLAASCLFFFNAALLFSLVSRWFSSFQPWLGSGAVLFLLIITMMMASSSHNIKDFSSSFRLFSPWDITNYLFPNLFNVYEGPPLKKLQFFYLPLGKNVVSIVGFYLLNYGMWSYGIWQVTKRCFRNPNTTVLTKGQSYVFIACSQVMVWGLNIRYIHNVRDYITFLNCLLVIGLIACLSPHRQTIQDWARYRHQNKQNKSLLPDLIWGEKSPALLAIAINLVIISTPFILWIFLSPTNNNSDKFKLILAEVLFISFMMICATIAQFILLTKTRKRAFWATGIVATVMFLPPMILAIFGIAPAKTPSSWISLWVFSSFPWIGIQETGIITIFMGLLAELSILTLLNFQLTRRVKLAGESATKALLAGR